ncbi:putative membrane protein [Gottschalkia acidurici 9a]|uniref:Membrane protein n=1 Tax=Gottschalkia acidurici (strain ATCC 7906 / DSM 604 / BCRC 14475 / CIP 104303 / KCTC 5404 / NCIMB 10678 / 9a) TaxID=1128398 RepID=K0AZA8_GOTA9|nr:AI-2E family transporter [Gottschalkia acidurici]AFS78035.1 putative membrane protein [Gottschalkia acidurici 9a]
MPKIIESDFFKKVIATLILIAVLFLIKGFIGLILLTMIEIVLVLKLSEFISKIFKNKFKNKRTINIFSFILLLGIAILFLMSFVPSIINQVIPIVKRINFSDVENIELFLKKYNINFITIDMITSQFQNIQNMIVKMLSQIQKISYNAFLSIVLSFVFISDNNSIKTFLRKFENCKYSYYYNFYKSLSEKFSNSFVKVIEAQLIIALVNALLSIIILTFFGFPDVMSLGFMIFILGLIPVAGVILSTIPLCIIAFQLGGLSKVILVIVMILILHAFESYFLNPKIMSTKMKLPIFLVFLILVISEHLMGTWGLIMGIPLFTFIVELITE